MKKTCGIRFRKLAIRTTEDAYELSCRAMIGVEGCTAMNKSYRSGRRDRNLPKEQLRVGMRIGHVRAVH